MLTGDTMTVSRPHWQAPTTEPLQSQASVSKVPQCPFNPYVEAMHRDFSGWAFASEAETFRGEWRQKVFQKEVHASLDLEIGTGNGFHFSHLCKSHPERSFVGMELKYKPLVQTLRRCQRQGSENGRMLRYDAGGVRALFADEEINNVYIHHPDPWPKKRHLRNRLIQDSFLNDLWRVMKLGSFLEFKTDHQGYFQWATQCFRQSPFTIRFFTEDLHCSSRSHLNYMTQFESLFVRKNQPIYYCLLEKKD